MDTQRNLLTVSLFAICAILYIKWIDFSNEAVAPLIQNQIESQVPDVGSEAPKATSADTTSVPLSQEIGVPQEPQPSQTNTLITVTTDMVIAKINPLGGVIQRLELRHHLADIEDPDVGFALLKNDASETFVTEDGLASSGQSPNHLTQYQYAQTNYELGDAESVTIPLSYVSEAGIRFIKNITFNRDSYVVDINYQVNNTSTTPWSGKIYGQFNRTKPKKKGGGFGQLPSYVGAAIYEPKDQYQKIDFDDIVDRDRDERKRKSAISNNKQYELEPYNSLTTNSGWVAMMQHYFVGVWLPPEGEKKFFTSATVGANPNYRAGFTSDFLRVESGQSGSIGTQLYLGSKETKRLNKLEKENGIDGVHLTVDYGFLTFIADPLFFALNWIHSIVGNWGWAIILLTILIKIAFYPLSAASYRSMGKMKKLQPRMQTLKERYKDDRQKFQTEMMAMYKKEKVNPAGGCLPILIQIPVFIALYWVLLESVEIRHAPFALWWQDLSAPDPYYVLPVLMGLTQFLMMKLNPAPMDDIQKKVMMIMPFALMFLFMTFPQGLVLYWVVNNILTMAQQWFNYRQQEKDA